MKCVCGNFCKTSWTAIDSPSVIRFLAIDVCFDRTISIWQYIQCTHDKSCWHKSIRNFGRNKLVGVRFEKKKTKKRFPSIYRHIRCYSLLSKVKWKVELKTRWTFWNHLGRQDVTRFSRIKHLAYRYNNARETRSLAAKSLIRLYISGYT